MQRFTAYVYLLQFSWGYHFHSLNSRKSGISHECSNFTLQNGETALHACALFGHFSILKKLIESGADPHIKNKVCQFIVVFDQTSSV